MDLKDRVFEEKEHIPARIATLKRSRSGWPVPWFVAWVDGEPDFRVIGEGKIAEAHNKRLCWLCGQRIGRFLSFVIGPMCSINRVSSEPPSHLECAQYAARVCPFLSTPEMGRRKSRLPDGHQEAVGCPVDRNPGVTLIWVTLSYRLMRVERGVLFELGAPHHAYWFARGREATRDEVLESIDSGLPLLQKMAAEDGEEGIKELRRRHLEALKLVP